MSNTVKVRIAYSGNALDNGAMDVNELAPALIAFAQLVKRTNTLIGNEQEIKIMLKADDIRIGSFDVVMQLVSGLLDEAKLFVGWADTSGLTSILQVLGWGYGSTKGIFWLIKEIKGRAIKEVEQKERSSIICLNDDSHIEIDNLTLNVYSDYDSRTQIERIIKPLMQNGIDSFELRNPEDYTDKEPKIAIMKSELPNFVAPEAEPNTEELVSVQTMIVKIVSLVFDKKQKWRFSDGEITFWANIEDEAFWNEVDTGERSFSNGDKMKVECQIRQHLDARDNPVTERTVAKVIEVIERPTQIKLPFKYDKKL